MIPSGLSDPRLGIAEQVTQANIALVVTQPSDANKTTGCGQTPGFYVAFGGNMGHGTWHRP